MFRIYFKVRQCRIWLRDVIIASTYRKPPTAEAGCARNCEQNNHIVRVNSSVDVYFSLSLSQTYDWRWHLTLEPRWGTSTGRNGCRRHKRRHYRRAKLNESHIQCIFKSVKKQTNKQTNAFTFANSLPLLVGLMHQREIRRKQTRNQQQHHHASSCIIITLWYCLLFHTATIRRRSVPRRNRTETISTMKKIKLFNLNRKKKLNE